MVPWRPIGVVLAVFASAASLAAADKARPRISPLVAEVRGTQNSLRFPLHGAPNPEPARRTQAGLETVIRYEIRLYRHNAHWFWDYKLGTRQYRAAVTYDPVTHEYVLVETMDDKPLSRFTTRDFA